MLFYGHARVCLFAVQPAAFPGRVKLVVRPWVLYTHVNGLLSAKVRVFVQSSI